MSLKERLSNQTKALQIEQNSEHPVYYPTSEVSQGINSLGEIDTLFADDEINSICVMGAKNIYIERKGKKSKISLSYRDNVRLENIIKKNAQFHGLQFDENHPYIEFNHKQGINVSATLPPLSSVATMIVKCYKDKFASLKMLAENLCLSKEIALFIEALAALKLNIIIAGEKNTLKTTILSTIAKNVAQNDNCVMIDYANEVKIENSNIVTYDFKNYNNENLLEHIISSNPDKIFLNDCPDLSRFDKYIEKGYRGICATYNCNSPLDVLSDLYLKNADVVIFVERKDQRRLISSISLTKGSELENIFYLNDNLEHNSSGIVPDFYQDIEKSALALSVAIFEADYKHTYHKTLQNDLINTTLKKNINAEILKKFKKDLDIEKEETSEAHKEDLEQENNNETL